MSQTDRVMWMVIPMVLIVRMVIITLLPLLMHIGEQFDYPKMFVLVGMATTSIEMANNVASLPNLTILDLVDENGENYRSTK